MANLSGIRIRYFNGITVADVNDLMKWIKQQGGLPVGNYVVDINKQGDVCTALLSNGKQISWVSGGGSGGTVYWADLAFSESDPTTIKQYMEDNFCPESFAVELDERLEVVEAAVTGMAPKVARALLTPIDTPSAIELVGIGTNGAQQQIRIGSGLEVVNSTIRATGGSGSQLYLHEIYAIIQSQGSTSIFGDFHIYIVNSNPDPLTASDVFYANGFISPVCKYTNQIHERTIESKLGTYFDRDRTKSGGGIIGGKNLIFQIYGWNKDLQINELTEVILAQSQDAEYLQSDLYFIMLDGTFEDTVHAL